MGSQTGMRVQVKVLGALLEEEKGRGWAVHGGLWVWLQIIRRWLWPDGWEYVTQARTQSPGSIRDPCVSLGHRVTKRVKNLAWCQVLSSAQDSFLQLANRLKCTVSVPWLLLNAPLDGTGDMLRVRGNRTGTEAKRGKRITQWCIQVSEGFREYRPMSTNGWAPMVCQGVYTSTHSFKTFHWALTMNLASG